MHLLSQLTRSLSSALRFSGQCDLVEWATLWGDLVGDSTPKYRGARCQNQVVQWYKAILDVARIYFFSDGSIGFDYLK